MTTIPVITTLLTKILNIVERLLDEWVMLNIPTGGVHMGDAANPYVGNCAPWANITCNMTACGSGFVEILEDVVHNALVLVSQSLVALISWENVPVASVGG